MPSISPPSPSHLPHPPLFVIPLPRSRVIFVGPAFWYDSNAAIGFFLIIMCIPWYALRLLPPVKIPSPALLLLSYSDPPPRSPSLDHAHFLIGLMSCSDMTALFAIFLHVCSIPLLASFTPSPSCPLRLHPPPTPSSSRTPPPPRSQFIFFAAVYSHDSAAERWTFFVYLFLYLKHILFSSLAFLLFPSHLTAPPTSPLPPPRSQMSRAVPISSYDPSGIHYLRLYPSPIFLPFPKGFPPPFPPHTSPSSIHAPPRLQFFFR